LIANVGQNRFEALDVAVDIAYEGSFHALKHRQGADWLEGGVACKQFKVYCCRIRWSSREVLLKLLISLPEYTADRRGKHSAIPTPGCFHLGLNIDFFEQVQ
jgi:hypothetical protein